MSTLSSPIFTSSPIATPSWSRTCARMSHERPTIAPSTSAPAADVRRRVDDRPDGARALAQGHARREHRVRADVRVARDPAVVRDQRRPLDLVEVVELHPLPQPHVAAQPDAGNRELHALVEGVEVRLPVLVEVADVLPVALHRQPVDRPPHLEEERKELLREVERPVGAECAGAPRARGRTRPC